jgi:hypothetical protein
MMKRQGDILLVKLSKKIATKGLAEIPRESDGALVLAHGEVTGHRHRFHGPKTEMHAPWPEKAQPQERVRHARELLKNLKELPSGVELVGLLTVPKAEKLVHEEHSAIPTEEGQYAVIRQRVFNRSRVELVAD